MATYKTKLIKKEEVAEGTMSFYFEKPEKFKFIAGQYLEFSHIKPAETDSEGNNRFFSIASAPYENNIMIATRMRDTAFKRVLKNLPIGSEIIINGPHGFFYLHKDASRPAVFLIGGIGITPVSSILKNAVKERLPHKLFLFYSNKRPEDTAFLRELQNLEKENPAFKLVATMTDLEKSAQKWQGETGFINVEMIRKYVGDLNLPVYYMSGPPQMVAAMMKLLEENGVKKKDMVSEEFAGY